MLLSSALVCCLLGLAQARPLSMLMIRRPLQAVVSDRRLDGLIESYSRRAHDQSGGMVRRDAGVDDTLERRLDINTISDNSPTTAANGITKLYTGTVEKMRGLEVTLGDSKRGLTIERAVVGSEGSMALVERLDLNTLSDNEPTTAANGITKPYTGTVERRLDLNTVSDNQPTTGSEGEIKPYIGATQKAKRLDLNTISDNQPTTGVEGQIKPYTGAAGKVKRLDLNLIDDNEPTTAADGKIKPYTGTVERFRRFN